jgi:Zn finger protein HypA/HybF involved in hydrogenase expression
MATSFECLGCGKESILEKLPARCPHCGHGNGLLREADEPAAAPRREEAATSYPDE